MRKEEIEDGEKEENFLLINWLKFMANISFLYFLCCSWIFFVISDVFNLNLLNNAIYWKELWRIWFWKTKNRVYLYELALLFCIEAFSFDYFPHLALPFFLTNLSIIHHLSIFHFIHFTIELINKLIISLWTIEYSLRRNFSTSQIVYSEFNQSYTLEKNASTGR